jgi:hypothetical protein
LRKNKRKKKRVGSERERETDREREECIREVKNEMSTNMRVAYLFRVKITKESSMGARGPSEHSKAFEH